MKKKLMLAALAGAAMLAVTGCSSQEKETEAQTKATAETTAQTEAAEAESEQLSETATDTETEAANEGVSEDLAAGTEAAELSTEELSTEETTEAAERPEYNALDYVELGEYKGLPVSVEEITVTEDEITDAVASAVEAAGVYDEVTDGVIENGDIANIDYEGKKDGVAFDGGTAQGYDLTIGSGTFIPGFEDGLVGVKVGETVDLDITFPEEYQSEELAGQAVVFTVKVNAIKRAPQITDDVVAKATENEYTTVAGYREYQKQALTDEKTTAQDSMILNELMTQLYNTCKVNSYPEELVSFSIAQMNNYYTQMASYYGMSLEDFIQGYFGMDLDTYNTQVDSSVKEGLNQELILSAIADQENIQVSDEEFEEGCQKYADNMGYENVDEFKAAYDEKQIRLSLRMDKALQFVKDNAIITVSEPESESEVVPSEAATEVEADETEVAEAATEAVEAATEAGTEK